MLLQDQGYILFHDAWMRSTRLVASFVKRNRINYHRLKCPWKNMILFQKNGQDSRAWYHFREFYTPKGIFAYPVRAWMFSRSGK
jgi:hypothetical protein